MLEIERTTKFKKDFKRVMQRPYFDAKEFEYVVGKLAKQEALEPKYKDHELTGMNGMRECHIKPDWLLEYIVSEKKLTLYLIRTGSHSDLF